MTDIRSLQEAIDEPFSYASLALMAPYADDDDFPLPSEEALER